MLSIVSDLVYYYLAYFVNRYKDIIEFYQIGMYKYDISYDVLNDLGYPFPMYRMDTLFIN